MRCQGKIVDAVSAQELLISLHCPARLHGWLHSICCHSREPADNSDCRCYCTTLHVAPSTVTLAAGCYVYPSKMEQVTNSRNHMHCFDACFESCELQARCRQRQQHFPRARVTSGWKGVDQSAAIVKDLALTEGCLQINRLSLYSQPA